MIRRAIHYMLFAYFTALPNAAFGQLLPILGAQRAGTATAQFLKIGVGARASAMAESFVAVANDASALYWNPAGITQFSDHQVIVSHTSWFVDIRHQFIGAVIHLTPDDAVGVSLLSVHTDDMQVTTELRPTGTGEYFRFGDIAVAATYSRKMTPQFSFGATVRYFEETLDRVSMSGFVLDFGTYYWMGLGTARFSAVISNFGNQMAPKGTVPQIDGSTISAFQEFSPPTAFRFGFAFDPVRDEQHTLTTSLQLNHPNDNSENLAIGLEYTWMGTFTLRSGYRMNVDEQDLSFGGGVATSLDMFTFRVDYGYTGFERLGTVHRLTLGVQL